MGGGGGDTRLGGWVAGRLGLGAGGWGGGGGCGCKSVGGWNGGTNGEGLQESTPTTRLAAGARLRRRQQACAAGTSWCDAHLDCSWAVVQLRPLALQAASVRLVALACSSGQQGWCARVGGGGKLAVGRMGGTRGLGVVLLGATTRFGALHRHRVECRQARGGRGVGVKGGLGASRGGDRRQTSTCEPTEWSRPLLDTSMGGTGSPAPRSTHRSYRRSARPRLHWPLNEQWDGRHARSCRGGGHVIGKNGNLPLADRDERPCSLRPSSKFAPYPWLRRQGRRPGSGSQRASSSLNALRYYEMERKCRRARCDGTA